MTGVATRNGNSDGPSGLTPLAQGLKNDRPEDSRSCPHECHGSLTLTDNDVVICQSCRCTPDGVYIAPYLDSNYEKAWRDGSRRRNPHPWKGQDGSPEREYYYGSGLARLAGGYENVYDEDDENRPNGVGDEYTWDLSTL